MAEVTGESVVGQHLQRYSYDGAWHMVTNQTVQNDAPVADVYKIHKEAYDIKNDDIWLQEKRSTWSCRSEGAPESVGINQPASLSSSSTTAGAGDESAGSRR